MVSERPSPPPKKKTTTTGTMNTYMVVGTLFLGFSVNFIFSVLIDFPKNPLWIPLFWTICLYASLASSLAFRQRPGQGRAMKNKKRAKTMKNHTKKVPINCPTNYQTNPKKIPDKSQTVPNIFPKTSPTNHPKHFPAKSQFVSKKSLKNPCIFASL